VASFVGVGVAARETAGMQRIAVPTRRKIHLRIDAHLVRE
jgi:hypothetical protein